MFDGCGAQSRSLSERNNLPKTFSEKMQSSFSQKMDFLKFHFLKKNSDGIVSPRTSESTSRKPCEVDNPREPRAVVRSLALWLFHVTLPLHCPASESKPQSIKNSNGHCVHRQYFCISMSHLRCVNTQANSENTIFKLQRNIQIFLQMLSVCEGITFLCHQRKRYMKPNVN